MKTQSAVIGSVYWHYFLRNNIMGEPERTQQQSASDQTATCEMAGFIWTVYFSLL